MENADNLSVGSSALGRSRRRGECTESNRERKRERERETGGIIQGVILLVAAAQSMHKVFINVARGHVKRARLSLSSLLSLLTSRQSSSASSLARSMQQTTVNQWASSAGSHPGIFSDGQRQQQQQHAPTRERV